jgi:hypothetical protein
MNSSQAFDTEVVSNTNKVIYLYANYRVLDFVDATRKETP